MSTDFILGHIIKKHVAENPDLDVATFVEIGPDREYIETVRTYQQLWDNGQKVANGLLKEGMQAEDRFAIFMHNHVEFVDAMVGSSIAATVFVPIDPRSKGAKLSYMLNFTECRGAVVSAFSLPAVLEIADELPNLEWLWVIDDIPADINPGKIKVKSLQSIYDDQVEELPIAANDPEMPMQMLFTSGTTGDPKAILSPYSRMGVAAMAYQLFGLNEQDRPYTGLSLTHANAQLLTLGSSLYAGMRCVISQKFTKSRLWDITRKYGCTIFNLLGGMTNAIYSEPAKDNDSDNPVRLVISAGMPKEIWNAFAERFNLEIYEFYGAAEGGFSANPPGVGPIGSIGKPPASMVCKIVDEDDNEVAAGEPGELIFQNTDGSTPNVKYFKNEEATTKKVAGGWLRMGDIGYQDEEGWLYFLFRKGGGIRKNGDFISPGILEKELAECDSVDDVFIYGVATPGLAPGERDIVAAIVPTDSGSFSTDEIFAYCEGRLEKNYIPDHIQVVNEIPKTASEKPQERFLVEDYDAGKGNVFSR